MTRKQTTKVTESEVEKDQESVEAIEVTEVTPEDPKSPVDLQTQASEKPAPAPSAPNAEKIQTDFREKLARKTDNLDVFVPSNPASLEKAASDIAKEHGFELNRGTSVGARLMARSQNKV